MRSDGQKDGGKKLVAPAGEPVRGGADPAEREHSDQERAGAGHPLGKYLAMLRQESFVSVAEADLLDELCGELIDRFPDLKPASVQAVRREMARPDCNKYLLGEKEAGFWRRSLARKETPVPGFDFPAALSRLQVTADSDPERTVIFLRPEHRCPLPPYVPRSMRMAEVFLLVALRMVRHHLRGAATLK